jgi:hypothetical protein
MEHQFRDFLVLSFLSLFNLVLSLFLSTGIAYAAQLTLAWNPNTEQDLAGYKIYYGTSSGAYEVAVNVGKWTSCTIDGFKEGRTYYLAATAYDVYGNESGFSNEVSYTFTELDSDKDGIPDVDEIEIYGTDPYTADTDKDGINDGQELGYWGEFWNKDFDGDGLINLLDPDADQDGFQDGSEIENNSDPMDPGSKPGLPQLETGEVIVDHNWKRVNFSIPFINPTVVAKPLSHNDPDPAVIRIRNVDEKGFDVRIQEWDYLDGRHATETVSYLAVEKGTYTLAQGTQIEAGEFDTSNTIFKLVTFKQTFSKVPVVLVAITSVNGSDAVIGRLRNITTQGFEFQMQEQELNEQTHAGETISYIAWEPSSGNLDKFSFEVNRTEDSITDQWKTVSFNQPFECGPVFIADMQTTDGEDTANLRWQNKTLNGVEVRVDEEKSRDDETSHTTEVVGYMVFSRSE